MVEREAEVNVESWNGNGRAMAPCSPRRYHALMLLGAMVLRDETREGREGEAKGEQSRGTGLEGQSR